MEKRIANVILNNRNHKRMVYFNYGGANAYIVLAGKRIEVKPFWDGVQYDRGTFVRR